MSRLTVSIIDTENSTTPLSISTGNSSAGFIKVEAANDDIMFTGTAKFSKNIIGVAPIEAFDTANAAFTKANNALANTTGTLNGSLTVTGDFIIGAALDEKVHTLSGTTVALNPSNGTIQIHTLTGSTTYTDSFVDGEAITLMIDDGSSFTVTSWPSVTWVNNAGIAPTLATTGYTVIVLWKVSTTLYGMLAGNGT